MTTTTIDGDKQAGSSADKPIIDASGLRRHVGEQVLVDNVSVSIHGGDRISIVGPTGSGKTVLLRALAMLDPLDAGRILWRGKPIRGNSIPTFRSRVMYVHQRPALIEGSIEDNLRQPFTLKVHAGKWFDRDRIVELLGTLGREASFLAKHQRDISGGEAQLTALLRSIQLEPDVLLLDEPTAALDAKATATVEKLVSHWLAEKPSTRAMAWVTHDLEQSERIATTVLKIQKGSLSFSSGVDHGRLR